MSHLNNAPSPTPVTVPAFSRPASVSSAPELAPEILEQMKSKFPNTHFIKAWVSPIPGLYALEMQGGRVAFCDKTGRYLILGLVFDSQTGRTLYNQMQGKVQ